MTTAFKSCYKGIGGDLKLTSVKADIYIFAVDSMLNQIDWLDEDDARLDDENGVKKPWRQWHDEQAQRFRRDRESLVYRPLDTNVIAFDILPINYKEVALHHVKSVLTDPESEYPSIYYESEETGLAGQAYCVAPIEWMKRYYIPHAINEIVVNNNGKHNFWNVPDYGCSYIIWEIAKYYEISNEKYLSQWEDENNEDFVERSRREAIEYNGEYYPLSVDSLNVKAWLRLFDFIDDLMLDVQDEDWAELVTNPEVYQEFVNKTPSLRKLLPLQNNSI